MMRKGRKLCAMLLTLALLLAALPPTTAWARPKTLDLTRVKSMGTSRTLTLKFGSDLSVNGKLANTALTDEALDELLAQLAAELKITPEQLDRDFDELTDMVNKYKRDQQFTKEDYDQMISDIKKLLGVVPVVDDIVKVLDILDQATTDMQGATDTASQEISKKSFEKALKIIAENYEDAIGAGFKVQDWAEAMKVCYDRFLRDKKKWENMRDGLNALKTLNDFYNKLNRRIEDYLSKHDKQWTITFDHAKSWEFYTLFGIKPGQNWDINMTLKQTSAASSGDWKGTYKGNFVIKIDYNMSTWRNQLSTAVYDMGKVGQGITNLESMFGSTLLKTVTNPGTCSVTRELTGEATVQINSPDIFSGVNATIDFAVRTNQKTVDISGVELSMSQYDVQGVVVGKTNIVNVFSADENYFYVSQPIFDVYYSMPGDLDDIKANYGGGSLQIPWSGNIWERSDKLVGKLIIGS